MTHLVFSYGTLMDADIQSALFGKTVLSEKDVLSDCLYPRVRFCHNRGW